MFVKLHYSYIIIHHYLHHLVPVSHIKCFSLGYQSCILHTQVYDIVIYFNITYSHYQCKLSLQNL
jgi:hypothetical protein